jgi:phospholipid/cholesterol/gamma-HCH transport system substrate-binding protein
VKRILAIASVLLAASALVVFGTAQTGDEGAYRVRAIFMNAFTVIPGEDVKVAGVKVGKIESLDVTRDHRAAVVLRIDRPGFDDFRSDAECTIRPQSFIGERFVECTPTQPRPDGAQEPPPLKRIEQGEGEGQYLLPVDRTSKPVDLDLLNNTLRLPFRERLAIIVNELGTGLAGRGADLELAIRNADPALKETDKVLRILADQNRALAGLARDGDAILAPLARERGKVADFVAQANTTAQATAQRSSDLEQDIAKLPAFLRELKPTMTRLGALSDEMTPVLRDLGAAAPGLNRLILALGPFSKAAIPTFQSLGEATDVGRPALVKSKPIIQELGRFASTAKPLSNDLSALLSSFRDSGGIERLMDYLFHQTTAINGYDSYGHYLRAGLLLNTCSQYAITPSSDCLAKFGGQEEGAETRAASGGGASYNDTRRSDDLRRLDAYLRGVDLQLGGAQGAGGAAAGSGGAAEQPTASQPAAPAQPQAAAASQPDRPRGDAAEALLDYLLGGAR